MICAAQFILQLDFSIVNVALPTIQRELGMAAADLQWIVTGYALTFGSLLLAGGRLADLLGRRRVLAAGLVVFALASLGAGLAQWPVMLIGARLLQGAAGALVSPSALSLLTTASPEGPARNKALALWQAATASGATTGIVAGGLLTQYLGWRAIFLVNPPLIAVLLAVVPRLPRGEPVGGGRIDVRGATLITAALAALIYGLTEGQQHGFTAPVSLTALVGAGLLAILFIHTERTVPAPMLPPSLLSEPARRIAVTMMAIVGAVLAGYVYFVSLYLQRVHRFSPLEAGLALVPATITVVLTSTLGTRRLLARFTIKQVLLAGLTSMTAGQLWLSQVTAVSSYPAAVLPGVVLTALSIGLVLTSVLLVGSALWLAASFFAARSDLDHAIGQGSGPAAKLAQADIDVQQIRGDAVLNVISRSGNTSFQDNFQTTSAQIGPGTGSLLAAAAAAQGGNGTGASLVAAAEREAPAWYAANDTVYSQGHAAQYEEERNTVLGTAESAGYSALEGDITGAIGADQGVFTSAATSGQQALDPLEAVVIAASLLMALGCGWAFSRRLAEYR